MRSQTTEGKFSVIIIILAIISLSPMACTSKPEAADEMEAASLPVNEVLITSTVIVMPKNKFLLVKEKSDGYCAVKFVNHWKSKSGRKDSSAYVSYSQLRLINGHFGGKDMISEKDKITTPELWGMGRMQFRLSNPEIKCGSIKLYWSGSSAVAFYKFNQEQGYHGMELAPTNWSSIEDVDFSDPRIKWYRYDSKRNDQIINIEEVWAKDNDK